MLAKNIEKMFRNIFGRLFISKWGCNQSKLSHNQETWVHNLILQNYEIDKSNQHLNSSINMLMYSTNPNRINLRDKTNE